MTTTRSNALAAIATAGLLALAGCGGNSAANPPTSGSASPSTAAASENNGTTISTSAAPSMSSSADLQTEAETLYRRQFVNFTDVVKKGGLAMAEPTPAVLSNDLADAALQKRLNEAHQIKEQGFKYISGAPRIVWVKPSSKEKTGTVVALESCEDGTPMFNLVNGQKTHGRKVRVDSYYAMVKGQLKMVDAVNHGVSSCAE